MSADKEKYIQLIRQLIPICELSPQGQTEIINSGTLLSVRKKGMLFKQGDRDNFSFYLLEGDIELHANNQQQNVICSGTDRALYAMAQLQPRQFSARAKTTSIVFQIQRDTLDRLMVLQEKNDPGTDSSIEVESSEMEVSELGEEDDVDWMTRMLQSELFSRMPTANIGQLFALLEEVPYRAGDLVIRQGDPGDKYYIIQTGTCHVLRKPSSGGKDIKLAELSVGDSFGEEALVSDSIRNATIAMATDGVLMELSKDNFIELIKKPTLQAVSYEEATSMVDAGAVWLDVRFKKEHDSHAIANSLHIPLNILRMQADKLDQGKKYIVYCDTSGRSSTGAFLLAERGFEVCYLEGGIVNNPDAADESEVTQIPPRPAPAKETPPPQPQVKAEPQAQSQDVVEEISKQNLDPDVKASVLEAELSRTNMQLEKVEKAKLKANTSIKEAQAEVEKQLQEERAKIELAKKQAEEEARKLRRNEEEKVKRMKEDAEKRLQKEKKKLEHVYSRNVEEMEKIEKMKQEAEAMVLKERERLAIAAEDARQQMEAAEAMKKEVEASRHKEAEEARKNMEAAEAMKKEVEASRQKEAEEARKNMEAAEVMKKEIEASRHKEALDVQKKMEEAQRLKAEVEASRMAMEKAAIEQRRQQEEMEKQIQQVAKAKLENERRKLSEEFARNNEDLEQAKRERAEAEAARQAARDEAAKIIAEYKMEHDQSHAAEEAKLREERLKLEEEQRKIQQTLLEVQKAKDEAETARQAAIQEIEQLRSRQKDEQVAAGEVQQDAINAEIRQAEEKVSKAAVDIVQAQQAQMKAVAAKNVNAVDLEKKKQLEEELHKQIKADLSQFRHEKEEEEKAYADSSTVMEKMRRIKESAEAARKKAKEKDVDLLGDIAAQLGDD